MLNKRFNLVWDRGKGNEEPYPLIIVRVKSSTTSVIEPCRERRWYGVTERKGGREERVMGVGINAKTLVRMAGSSNGMKQGGKGRPASLRIALLVQRRQNAGRLSYGVEEEEGCHLEKS